MSHLLRPGEHRFFTGDSVVRPEECVKHECAIVSDVVIDGSRSDVVATVGGDDLLFEIDAFDVGDRYLPVPRAHSRDGVLSQKDDPRPGTQLKWGEVIIRTHGVVIDEKTTVGDDGVLGLIDSI